MRRRPYVDDVAESADNCRTTTAARATRSARRRAPASRTLCVTNLRSVLTAQDDPDAHPETREERSKDPEVKQGRLEAQGPAETTTNNKVRRASAG